jgi:hypothetical protein
MEKEENKLEFKKEEDQANSEEISPSDDKLLIQPKPVEWKTKRTVSTKYNLDGAFAIKAQDGNDLATPVCNIQMRFTDKLNRRQYTRETKADRKGKKVGRWTRTEHIRFIQAIRIYGRNDYQ